MSRLTIEFELSEDAAILIDGDISIDLGSGVHMLAKAPRGLERINWTKLQIVMDVEGTINARTEDNQPTLLRETNEDKP
jgi:hypothetical protein